MLFTVRNILYTNEHMNTYIKTHTYAFYLSLYITKNSSTNIIIYSYCVLSIIVCFSSFNFLCFIILKLYVICKNASHDPVGWFYDSWWWPIVWKVGPRWGHLHGQFCKQIRITHLTEESVITFHSDFIVSLSLLTSLPIVSLSS